MFGLQLLDHGGGWSWADVSSEDIYRVAQVCKDLESMRALELLSTRRNKAIPFTSLAPEAQRRLTDIGLDDYDKLWELRVAALARIWGICQEHIFYLVWWDPDHEVCPSPKKHT